MIFLILSTPSFPHVHGERSALKISAFYEVNLAVMMFLRVLALSAILSSISAHQWVRMERDVAISTEWLRQKYDASETNVELTFAVKLNNADKLHNELMRVSSPLSKDYGKLYSHKEIKALTLPSADSISAVTSYLKEFGVNDFKVVGGFVKAVVNVHVAEKLLSTTYNSFAHKTTGEKTVRCTEYSLPEGVSKYVDFVAPTVNFPRPLRVKQEVSAPTSNTPDSLRALYGVGDAQGGKSAARQAVTAFLHQYYTEDDLQSFYQTYYPTLFGTPISKVVGPNGDMAGIEASLDVEYMTTLGSGVPTEFWSFDGRQPNNTQNEPFLDWLVQLDETEDPPLVFSTSYGEDEASVSFDYAERMNQEFMQNSLRGITFLFASGDSGVGSAFGPCTTYTPQYPSDSPYVTAVGATTGTNPETAAGLSSGGFSNRYARPSWQDDAVASYFATAAAVLPDATLYNSSGRGFPDVSAQGTGFTVINNGMTMPAVAGTSCSSPTFGGIVAMLVSLHLYCFAQ